MIVGPSFGSVTVNPSSPPGSPPGNTTMATGLVSASNFVTWNTIGADSVPLPTNTLSSLFSTQGTPIASVILVSNSPSNPTQASPTPLPVTGTTNLQRRTTGFSFSADFSSNEALLFANAANAGLIIDFAVPVSAAGFRVQNNTFGTDNNFFLQAFNASGGGYVPASPLFDSLSVTTSSFVPFSDSAPFYGVEGTGPSDTFTRLWIGFDSANPFTISTLEMIQAGGTGPTNPVPLPPTAFAAAFGMLGLARLHSIRCRIA